MSDIDFETGAVCYGDGRQWFVNTGFESGKFELVNNDGSRKYSLYGILNFPKDFQLNEIREGDFIPAPELDTEQKYNEVIEVFGLFGFKPCKSHSKYIGMVNYWKGVEIYNGEVANTNATDGRKLTYPQIIAIGKLKRMMLEREKEVHKAAYNSKQDLMKEGEKLKALQAAKESANQVKNPKHYQLIEGVESIEIIARSMTKEQWKGFCLGNMLKYRLRCGKKHSKVDFEDIEKANYYEVLYEKYKGFCCADKRI